MSKFDSYDTPVENISISSNGLIKSGDQRTNADLMVPKGRFS